MRLALIIAVTIIGILLGFARSERFKSEADSIPVCTEKKVSPIMYCDYCHDDGTY